MSKRTSLGREGAACAILYALGGVFPDLKDKIGKVVEIRIPSKHLTTKNKQVQTRQLWGSDVYTDDSDLVALLMHTGLIFLRPASPTGIPGVSVFCRLMEPLERYPSEERYGLKSRVWPSKYHRCSLKLVRVQHLQDDSMLDPSAAKGLITMFQRTRRRRDLSSAAVLRRKRKFVEDVSIVFNSENDPCLRYNLALIADRGVEWEHWTSTRLRKEVLYLETDTARYELSYDSEGGASRYTFAQVVVPPSSKRRRVPIFDHKTRNANPTPLKDEAKTIIKKGLRWDEIEWGPKGVEIGGKHYPLRLIHFKPLNTNTGTTNTNTS